MHRHDCSCARSDCVFDGAGGEGQALVDVDDDRDGPDGQDRRRGGHIGMGRDYDFVAGAEFQGRHSRGKRIAAARRQGEMLYAEIARIAALEAVALVPDAVSKKSLRAQNPCNGFDFFLANDVHG